MTGEDRTFVLVQSSATKLLWIVFKEQYEKYYKNNTFIAEGSVETLEAIKEIRSQHDRQTLGT